MPFYQYTAVNQGAKSVKGSLEADSLRAARQKLRNQGLFPSEVREVSSLKKGISGDIFQNWRSERANLKDLAIMTRQLATLVGAGLPLVEALHSLAGQTASLTLKKIVTDVREKVEQGSSLNKALAGYPKAFPRLYINMIASGEETGSLDTVLDNMADYLESQLELKRKVVSALLYPVLMLGFCVLVVIALLVFVVPNIVEIFEKEGTILPLPTRILIGVSDFIASYWWLVGFLSLAFISALTTYYRSPGGRNKIDGLLLKLPVYGAIYTKVTTARVSRTLGTLLNGGVGLLAALEIVKNIVNNCLVSEALAEAKEGVREGRSLANELKKSGHFPILLCQMVAVGEKSGHLEDMLTRAGKSYENEVNATLSGLTSLLTPVMTIFLGLIVLFIVVAALMPMMDMIELVQG